MASTAARKDSGNGRSNFYLHNSHKGYTCGCIDTMCDDLLNYLIKYRDQGNSQIDFVIKYEDATTYGGTRR
jgi:hypothetical protein